MSNVTVNDILSNPDITGMSYDSIAALGDSSVDSNDPWYDKAVKIQQLQKAWFFRGHYGGAASEGDMFSHATSNYNGLYLAYNKIAAGTVVDVTDATKVVPHIKLYLQVQTENIASGSDGTGDVALAKDSVVNSYCTGDDRYDWCLDVDEYVMLPAFGQAPSHPAIYNSDLMDEETAIIVQEGLIKLSDDEEGKEILNDLLNTNGMVAANSEDHLGTYGAAVSNVPGIQAYFE